MPNNNEFKHSYWYKKVESAKEQKNIDLSRNLAERMYDSNSDYLDNYEPKNYQLYPIEEVSNYWLKLSHLYANFTPSNTRSHEIVAMIY